MTLLNQKCPLYWQNIIVRGGGVKVKSPNTNRAYLALSDQERGRRSEHGQGLILSFWESVQNTN